MISTKTLRLHSGINTLVAKYIKKNNLSFPEEPEARDFISDHSCITKPFLELDLEKNRNWHWMWSTFYFHKKHKGFFVSFLIILPKFFSAKLKARFK